MLNKERVTYRSWGENGFIVLVDNKKVFFGCFFKGCLENRKNRIRQEIEEGNIVKKLLE